MNDTMRIEYQKASLLRLLLVVFECKVRREMMMLKGDLD
jgi:hypothetical protein